MNVMVTASACLKTSSSKPWQETITHAANQGPANENPGSTQLQVDLRRSAFLGGPRGTFFYTVSGNWNSAIFG